jgi:uncharacterized coiled-coil DUF342 family protein
VAALFVNGSKRNEQRKELKEIQAELMELQQDVSECKTDIADNKQEIHNIDTRHIPPNIKSKLINCYIFVHRFF